jgi:hypothetical protein
MSSEQPTPTYKVQLAVYDLSQGMARALSQGLLGIQIEGIWHTGTAFQKCCERRGGGQGKSGIERKKGHHG